MAHTRKNGNPCMGRPYMDGATMRTMCTVCKEEIKAPVAKSAPKAIVASDDSINAALRRRLDPNYKEVANPYKEGIVGSDESIRNAMLEKAEQRTKEAAEKDADGPAVAVAEVPPTVVKDKDGASMDVAAALRSRIGDKPIPEPVGGDDVVAALSEQLAGAAAEGKRTEVESSSRRAVRK